MKIQNFKLIDAVAALQRIDGDSSKIKFKIGASTRYTLAKNLDRMMAHNALLMRMREGMLKEYGLGMFAVKGENGAPIENPENYKKFHQGWTEIGEREEEIVISMLDINELRLDENDVPVNVIAAIMFMIKE